MKERTVMLSLEVKSWLPIRILRRAKNYQIMVKKPGTETYVDEITVVQAQANVIRRRK